MTTKEEVQALQRVIQVAQYQIDAIRKECKHEHRFQGKWSYRVGSYVDAVICSDCGGLVELKTAMFLPVSEANMLTEENQLTQEEIATLGEEQLRLDKEWEQEQKKHL